MYNDEYFYGITDIMHYNLYITLLKEHIIKEERVIVQGFKRNEEEIIIENNNGNYTYIKDTRLDKNEDITNFDLIFLQVLDRFYSDYEIPGMIYENINNIGSWYRVKIPGYNPNDKLLKPFYLKKRINKEDLVKYAKNEEELKYLERFYDITKGLINFTKREKVENLLNILK